MFHYTLISSPIFSLNTEIIENIFIHIEKEISIPQNGIIHLIFLPPNEIQSLNKAYRNKDVPTDVLSFHYFDDFSKIWENDIAWELVFCEEKIISQWAEYGLWAEFEFYKLLIHSLLHIVWYDHEIDSEYLEMQNLEDRIALGVFWRKLA